MAFSSKSHSSPRDTRVAVFDRSPDERVVLTGPLKVTVSLFPPPQPNTPHLSDRARTPPKRMAFRKPEWKCCSAFNGVWNGIRIRLSKHIRLILKWKWTFLKLNSNSTEPLFPCILMRCWNGNKGRKKRILRHAASRVTLYPRIWRFKLAFFFFFLCVWGCKLYQENRALCGYVFHHSEAGSQSQLHQQKRRMSLIKRIKLIQDNLSGPDRLATGAAVCWAAAVPVPSRLNENLKLASEAGERSESKKRSSKEGTDAALPWNK